MHSKVAFKSPLTLEIQASSSVASLMMFSINNSSFDLYNATECSLLNSFPFHAFALATTGETTVLETSSKKSCDFLAGDQSLYEKLGFMPSENFLTFCQLPSEESQNFSFKFFTFNISE